jgi:HD domain
MTKETEGSLQPFEDILASLLAMAWIVEARDPYTGGHLWRVSQYARLLAADMGLSDGNVARIAVGAFLHDIGKIGIPDAILKKADRLTDAEYEIIKTHPEIGLRMLAGHPLRGLVEAALLSHHETADGTGYPRGLACDEIPLDARIVGVCDAFDAMTSTRPYRPPLPKARALEIVEANLDRQFDAAVGARFLALARTGALDHITGHSDEGIPLQACPVCGPTLAVAHSQPAGSNVYCPSCGGEFRVESKTPLRVRPTGRHGTPRDLQPAPDIELIARLVREAAVRLAPQLYEAQTFHAPGAAPTLRGKPAERFAAPLLFQSRRSWSDRRRSGRQLTN